MNRLALLITILLITLAGCKKDLSGPKNSQKYSSLSVKNIKFDYLNTNSRIKYDGPEKSIGGSAKIRIKKDSIIWISLSPGFGIEAARGLITRDSIKFLNRFENQYSAFDFEELSRKFNFNLNFDLMQAILLGNMPKVRSASDQVVKKENHYIIKQLDGALAFNNYISQQNMKVTRLAIFANNGSQNARASLKNNAPVFDNYLNLEYDKFKVIENQILPFKNLVSLNYKEGKKSVETTIDIQHRQASFEKELSFPFEVPEKYD